MTLNDLARSSLPRCISALAELPVFCFSENHCLFLTKSNTFNEGGAQQKSSTAMVYVTYIICD